MRGERGEERGREEKREKGGIEREGRKKDTYIVHVCSFINS